MTIVELGSLGEFVASIGMLCSLIYVGVQLQQGRKLTRIDGLEKRLDRWIAWRRLTTQDAGLLQLWQKGNDNLESLTADESHVFDGIMLEAWLIMRSQYSRSKELKDANELDQATRNAQDFLRLGSGREWWRKRRKTLAPPFREWVDSVSTDVENET